MKRFNKRQKLFLTVAILAVTILISGMLVGCTSRTEKTTLTVFAAKSLNSAMDELIEVYRTEHADLVFESNYDSSGTLQVQIEEGARCDIFFPAAQAQMDTLEAEGYLVPGTRTNVVSNRVCLVTYKGSNTEVTGIHDLDKAGSMALAGGSVPVGKYTRAALVNAKLLDYEEDVSGITSEEISSALGGLPINDCANVGAVAAAVAESSNEIGTVYCSDYKGYEEKLTIIEILPRELTGDVIYPAAAIVNEHASEAEHRAAADFLLFLKSERAKEIFEKYAFDTTIE